MENFDQYIGIDWSGANEMRSRPNIRVAKCDTRGCIKPFYPREIGMPKSIKKWKRSEIKTYLTGIFRSPRRTLVGVDAAFGYPKGFGKRVCDASSWHEMVRRVAEEASGKVWNDVLKDINGQDDGGYSGPFYFGTSKDVSNASMKSSATHNPYRYYANRDIPYYRLVENYVPQAISTFYAGAGPKVAAHTITWLPVLHALMKDRAKNNALDFGVWPQEEDWSRRRHVIAECYPALYRLPHSASVDAKVSLSNTDERDAARTAYWMQQSADYYLDNFPRLNRDALETVREEGWIIGVEAPAHCTLP